MATLKAETAVAVHVLGIDPDLRVLLDQGSSGPGSGWSLPAGVLATGQDPNSLAQLLVRRAGAVPRKLQVVDIESEFVGACSASTSSSSAAPSGCGASR